MEKNFMDGNKSVDTQQIVNGWPWTAHKIESALKLQGYYFQRSQLVFSYLVHHIGACTIMTELNK